jgi:nucleotide-binding universal stress UspA family protein
MFKRILIPLDGSKLAECTLPHFAALSQLGDPEGKLIRILEPPDSQGRQNIIDPVDWQLRKVEAENYLNDLAVRLQNAGLRVTAQISEGRSAEHIIGSAHEWDADLILMSSHGQSGISPWNVSSIVQQVIFRVRRSFMIVRAYQPQYADLLGLQYKKIFLPLDGSQRAEMTLSLAETLNCVHQGILLIAHIVDQPGLPRRTPPSQEDIQLVETLTERNRIEADSYLAELKTRLMARGCANVNTILEISPRVARTLHRIADENSIDLTVLSAHGYTGDTHWPFGSVVSGFITYGSSALLILQDLPVDRIEQTYAEIAAREFIIH